MDQSIGPERILCVDKNRAEARVDRSALWETMIRRGRFAF